MAPEMPVPQVAVRAYRDVDLEGGTLVVAVPHIGLGGLFLTDQLLEQLAMEHVAGLDSDAFPPLAMLRGGKARFPARIHADPASRLAVLRCDFEPPPFLARPLARALMAWAREQRIARIVTVEELQLSHPRPSERGDHPQVPGGLWFVASNEETRRLAVAEGLRPLEDVVVAGVPAVLMLEARFPASDVLALFAARHRPSDDARAALALAKALPAFVPGLRLDAERVERNLGEVERAVRALQAAAEQELGRLSERERPPSAMYGGG